MHEAIIYSFFVSITSLIVFRSEVISHLIVVWCFDNYLLSATTTLIWLYILQLLDLSASLETYCYIIVLLQSCLKQITILTNLHYNQFKINQPSPWEVWNENLLFNWLFKKKKLARSVLWKKFALEVRNFCLVIHPYIFFIKI